jgi:hypothetical protein
MATNNNNDIIRLNVGGQHFITSRVTLCAVEGSLLANMFRSDSNFAPPIEIDGGGGGGGEVFLDRNPISFGYILDYLRDGCRVMVDLPSNNNDEEALLQRLLTDADYFGLEGLVLYCDTKLSIISKKHNEREHERAMMEKKEKMEKTYEYKQTSDCNCLSGNNGWRLYKHIPSIYDIKGERVERGKFIFERIY